MECKLGRGCGTVCTSTLSSSSAHGALRRAATCAPTLAQASVTTASRATHSSVGSVSSAGSSSAPSVMEQSTTACGAPMDMLTTKRSTNALQSHQMARPACGFFCIHNPRVQHLARCAPAITTLLVHPLSTLCHPAHTCNLPGPLVFAGEHAITPMHPLCVCTHVRCNLCNGRPRGIPIPEPSGLAHLSFP